MPSIPLTLTIFLPPFLLDSLSSEGKDLMRSSHVDSLEEEKRIDFMSSLEVDVMGVGMRSGGERHAAEKEKMQRHYWSCGAFGSWCGNLMK